MEIVKDGDRSKLYYYFGRNTNHDYIATEMKSAIIAGYEGSGKSTLINSMLIRMIMETNPGDVDIYWHDLCSSDAEYWKKCTPEGKVLPHFSEIVDYSNEALDHNAGLTGSTFSNKLEAEFYPMLEEAREVMRKRMYEVQRTGSYTWGENSSMGNGRFTHKKFNLIIIDEFPKIVSDPGPKGDPRWFRDVIKELVTFSGTSGIFVLLASRGGVRFLGESLIREFPIRVATRLDEKDSNVYLDCNVAACETAKYGLVFVKNSIGLPQRLYGSRFPYTWIKKFIRYYSVYEKGKGPVNADTKDE